MAEGSEEEEEDIDFDEDFEGNSWQTFLLLLIATSLYLLVFTLSVSLVFEYTAISQSL